MILKHIDFPPLLMRGELLPALLLWGLMAAFFEQYRQQHPGDKPANVSPKSYSPDIWPTQGEHTAEKLQNEPHSKHNYGWDSPERHEIPQGDEGEYTAVRIKHEVSAQNRSDSSAGANRGDNGQRVCDGVHECGCHAANQVKHQVAQVPPCVFNIIAEDPQVKHISAQVQEPRMHEHGSENIAQIAEFDGCHQEIVGDKCKLV